MNYDLLKSQFDEVCQKVIEIDNPYISEPDLEPAYKLLLNFLIENQENRAELAKYLNAIIYSGRFPKPNMLSSTAIQYCMHVLRWHEVYEFARTEIEEFHSKKTHNSMHDFLDAFNDDWADRDFYQFDA